MLRFSLLFYALILNFGCKSDVREKFEQQVSNSEKFEQFLESQTSQDWQIAKINYGQPRTVFKNNATGEFVAYNVDLFAAGNFSTLNDYQMAASSTDIIRNLSSKREWVESGYYEPVYGERVTTDSFGNTIFEKYVIYESWVDTSSWETFYYGGGFKFENQNTPNRDLETLASLAEEENAKVLTQLVSSQFSLSLPRATEITRLIIKQKKLENVRALTLDEKNRFALSALGVSMNQVENALKEKNQGFDRNYQELIQKVADYNKTTIEAVQLLFNHYID
jgi:hypothetical protein